MEWNRAVRHSQDQAACTIQRRNGRFCDTPSGEDFPFPICPHHAIELYQHMADVVAANDNPASRAALAMAEMDALPKRVARPASGPSVVYYLRVGSLIKIGTTTNLARRMQSYPPDAVLLATEEGGPQREAEVHDQFATDLAGRREWFHPSPNLMAHIATLQ